MSIFKNIFQSSSSENEQVLNWIQLTESKQLTSILNDSNHKFVLIFKHSTRCGISRMVLKNFEKTLDANSLQVDLYFLNLLEYRLLSNEIASAFKVEHQSPQVILIYKEKVVYEASHSAIDSEMIKKIILKK